MDRVSRGLETLFWVWAAKIAVSAANSIGLMVLWSVVAEDSGADFESAVSILRAIKSDEGE